MVSPLHPGRAISVLQQAFAVVALREFRGAAASKAATFGIYSGKYHVGGLGACQSW